MRLYTLQNNRYKIQAILGQGGYGITYLAEQTTLGRQVAIKEFFMKDYCGRAPGSPEVTLGTDGSREMLLRYREKFKKEAATLARLNHPNIVRVIDMFEENNTYYYVMEYADGPSLSQIVKIRGKLPIDEALAMIKQVADAVSYLHQERLCHYDIKPANILTSKKGQVILADFGLAKQYDEQGEETTTSPVGKSKGYAPPEQYHSGGVSTFSPETDIYALAATLYKLLTGITPIESLSRNDEEIDFSVLPAALITPIQKAMNLKRKERFHSVEEFLAALPEVEVNLDPVDEDKTDPDELIDSVQDIHSKSERTEKKRRRINRLSGKSSIYILITTVICANVVGYMLWNFNNRPSGKSENLFNADSQAVFIQGNRPPFQQRDSIIVKDSFLDSINDRNINNIENRTLYYTSTDHKKMDLVYKLVDNNPKKLTLVSNEYKDGQGKAIFDGPIETIGCYYDDWRLLRLSSIKIPNSVKTIFSNFMGFDQLENFYGKYASEDHRFLIKDDTLKAIAYGFKGYDLNRSKNSNKLKDIVIPEGVKVIDELPQCRIKSLTLPQSLVSIVVDNYWLWRDITCDRFYGKYASEDHRSVVYNGTLITASNDESMTHFNIPSNARTLGDVPGHLRKIYIPKTINKIHKNAFANRWNIDTIFCEFTIPPILMNGNEFNTLKTTFRIFVPREAVNRYKEAKNWKNYANRIFPMQDEDVFLIQ